MNENGTKDKWTFDYIENGIFTTEKNILRVHDSKGVCINSIEYNFKEY